MCYSLLAEIFLITSDKSFVVGFFPPLILSRPLRVMVLLFWDFLTEKGP